MPPELLGRKMANLDRHYRRVVTQTMDDEKAGA
jgi:hypothetical protein